MSLEEVKASGNLSAPLLGCCEPQADKNGMPPPDADGVRHKRWTETLAAAPVNFQFGLVVGQKSPGATPPTGFVYYSPERSSLILCIGDKEFKVPTIPLDAEPAYTHSLIRSETAPENLPEGSTYYNTKHHCLYVRGRDAWEQVMSAQIVHSGQSPFLHIDPVPLRTPLADLGYDAPAAPNQPG